MVISCEFLVYSAAIHNGRFVNGCSGVSRQNCPFASLHCLNCSLGMSIALVLSSVLVVYVIFHGVIFNWYG